MPTSLYDPALLDPNNLWGKNLGAFPRSPGAAKRDSASLDNRSPQECPNVTFCANARGRIISAILVVIAVTVADVCLAQDVPAVRINVHNESGAAIAGATVRIQSDRGVSIDTTTGTDGRAAIPQLAPGEYRIVIAAEDFQQLSHLVSVQTEGQEIDLEFTLVPELRRTDSVDVIATAQDVGLQPSSLASEELRSADVALLPLRPSTVVDALPLVPGVNRSSDGEIQIGGQGEQRSALLVNTAMLPIREPDDSPAACLPTVSNRSRCSKRHFFRDTEALRREWLP